ncbi:MAG: anaerobic ribonucleoside-triphosphate reductase activating protein [Spirochaetales bacterium]|nr:anaerobic ribonucleoside-triphosphate reductase activating protein [Spirochaetales bacterium]
MNLPRFAGLQKTSLIDYPGNVAAVLFLPGCNIRCSYCHNPDLALGRTEGLLDWNEITGFIKQRAPLLGGVVISGGEPLLHRTLADMISWFRNETSLKIKVDTNGLLPDRLEKLTSSEETCPDFIAMDIKTVPEAYSSFGLTRDARPQLEGSIEIIKKSGIQHHFRSTVHPDYINIDMIDEIAGLIKGNSEYILNPFMPGNCLNPEFNSHPAVGEQQLTGLQKEFEKRGINCRVPSIKDCCNSL